MSTIIYTSFSTGYRTHCNYEQEDLIGSDCPGEVFLLKNNPEYVVKRLFSETDTNPLFVAYQELNALDHLSLLEGYIKKNNGIFIIMKKEKGIPLTRKKREIRASITAEYQKPSPLTKNLRKHSENLFKVTDTAVQALIKINGKGVCHLGLIHNDENILYDVATNEASIINYGFSLLHFGWMTGLFANEKAKQYPQEIEELNQEFKGGIFKIPLITSPLFTFENMLTIYPYYYPVSYILNTGFWLSLPSSFAVIQFLIIRIIVTLIATITLPILCSDPCSKTLARENSFIIAASSIVLITLLSACLYFSLPSLLFIAAFGQSIFTSGFIATLAPIISSYSGMLQLLAALHVANHYVQPIPSFLFVAIKPHLPDWLLSLCIEIRFNPNYRPSTYFKRAFYSRPETVSSAAAKTAPAPEPSMA